MSSTATNTENELHIPQVLMKHLETFSLEQTALQQALPGLVAFQRLYIVIWAV